MKTKLGFFSIVLLGINAIVGSGIFLLPSKIYQYAGNYSILLILLNAFLVTTIALCFAEAAGMYSQNGGAYVYVKEAFGEFYGFIVGFMRIAIAIIAWATMANAFVTTVISTLNLNLSTIETKIFIVSFICILSSINLLGVKMSKSVSNIVTSAKLIPILFTIIVGIFFINPKNYSTNFTITNMSQAMLLIFYAFTGFEAIPGASEDMENPKKNLPIAIIVVLAIVSLIYILLVGVTIGILGEDIASSTAPIADAVGVFVGSFGFILVSTGTLISIGGINFASSFLTPRSISSMANDNLLPKELGKYSKNNVPYISIIIVTILTSLLAVSGSFIELASISVIARFVQYIPTCLAIIVMRYTKKDVKRNFKVPFGPIIPSIAIIMCIWLLAQASQKQLIFGLGGIFIAIPVYFLVKKFNKVSS